MFVFIAKQISCAMRAGGCALLLFAVPVCGLASDAAVMESMRAQRFSIPGPASAAGVPVPKSPDAAGPGAPEDRHFSGYIMKAVDWLYANYGLLGYDIRSILTHDIAYHTSGDILARNPPLTMCVAAQMEVILTAYRIYAEETGDYSVYEYLPKRSFEGLRITDLKGHIWVNHDFNSYGTADALINFGMGERTAFEDLRPGSFVNINRDNRTGHAVTFINFINVNGEPQAEYNGSVVGFRYFSSNGGSAGSGGLGYGNAIFRQHGCPWMPDRDCGVIYSTNQNMLNTGTMLSPKHWDHSMVDALRGLEGRVPDTVLDEKFFNGVAPDKINPDY